MRFFACALLLSMLLGAGNSARAAEARALPDVTARAAILMERKSGRVLFEMNADQLMPIASITKVMTALLTIEQCDLVGEVTVSANASGIRGTSIYLSEGEMLTVHQLLQGLLLRSGNDAAIALAEYVAGSVDAFVDMMNDRAALLGADAHFTNPHGLDEKEHVASARGMALIANEAMDYPIFRELVATQRAIIPWPGNQYDRVLENKNKLLTRYPGATGVKTGFTDRAGRCLIFSAEREGMEVLGVLLNCGQWFDAAARMMDWAFEGYEVQRFLRMNQEVKRVPVIGGMEEEVAIVAPMALTAPVAAGEEARLVIETEAELTAPVYVGAIVGLADVVVGQEVIASMVLVAGETVLERTYASGFMRLVRHFNPVG